MFGLHCLSGEMVSIRKSVLAVITLFALLGLPLGSLASASGGQTRQLIGHAMFKGGLPATGLPVSVYREPTAVELGRARKADRSAQRIRIGMGRTDDRGRFAVVLEVPPSTGAATSGVPEGAGVPISVEIGNGPVGMQTLELVPDSNDQRLPTSVVVDGTTPVARATDVGAASVRATAAKKTCPLGWNYSTYWKRIGSKPWVRPVTVGRVKTGSGTTASVTYKKSDGTATEAFLNYGSGLAGMGMTRLKAHTADTSFSAFRNQGREFRVETRYYAWDLWCSNSVDGKTWMTPIYKWQAELWTGGTSIKYGYTPGWPCRAVNVAKIASPLRVGDNESITQTINGGVNLGTNVVGRVSQTLSSEFQTSVRYALASGKRSAKLCGLNGVPSTQLEMKEVS